MQKITPFLWFDSNAEEATNFYVSVFKNSRILNIARYGDAGPRPKGTVMTVNFQPEGQDFMGAERWSTLHFFSGHIVLCKLRDAGRG
jgi:predicted 3-demethylubiquinone-9 3-methyltransferase (glyoxalase superfamily)